MSIIQSGNRTHDATANTAEMTRQVADDKARATFLVGGTDAAYAAALQANAVTYYRAVISSSIANGLQYTVYSDALHRLREAIHDRQARRSSDGSPKHAGFRRVARRSDRHRRIVLNGNRPSFLFGEFVST